MSTLRVAVLGGGRSSEHEVSLASAASVCEGLRAGGHDVAMIEIGLDGVWRQDGREVTLEPGRGLRGVRLDPDRGVGDGTRKPGPGSRGCDVVFPVLHGPFGEDGTVQGLLECLGVPYVGAGVLASALCMDKVTFKHLMAREGVPQVDYRALAESDFRARPRETLAGLGALGLPVFVKPARLGSSVGILRVGAAEDLRGALDIAFEYDSLAIVEGLASGLEVECSVIGNDEPIASEPGEILLAAGETGWYDYEAKYTPGKMQLVVPARVPSSVRDRVRELAIATFVKSGCRGLARVDFFVDGDHVIVNELNTMPGFTSTSVFASLFEASGIPYVELLDRLLALALDHHEAERRHRH